MNMKPHDFRFHHPLRVRWAEVDVQQIVFNPHYLMYLDTAVADYWRALAMPYAGAMALLQGEIFLRKTTVEFNASAGMDDRLDVALRCDRIGNSSMGFVGAIFCDHRLLVSAELVYVFADQQARTSGSKRWRCCRCHLYAWPRTPPRLQARRTRSALWPTTPRLRR